MIDGHALNTTQRMGAVGYATTELPTETSALTKAALTFASTQDLCRRIQTLTDRLVGSVPTPVQNARGAGEVSASAFPALRQMADETASLVQFASEALDRIERSLP